MDSKWKKHIHKTKLGTWHCTECGKRSDIDGEDFNGNCEHYHDNIDDLNGRCSLSSRTLCAACYDKLIGGVSIIFGEIDNNSISDIYIDELKNLSNRIHELKNLSNRIQVCKKLFNSLSISEKISDSATKEEMLFYKEDICETLNDIEQLFSEVVKKAERIKALHDSCNDDEEEIDEQKSMRVHSAWNKKAVSLNTEEEQGKDDEYGEHKKYLEEILLEEKLKKDLIEIQMDTIKMHENFGKQKQKKKKLLYSFAKRKKEKTISQSKDNFKNNNTTGRFLNRILSEVKVVVDRILW